jgi:stalled ribosome rescue protein Dom34
MDKEMPMKKQVGLWIDHRKAVIVTLLEKGEEIKVIESNVEKQLRRTGETPLKGPFARMWILADTRRHKAYVGQLNAYYDQVGNTIRDADSALLFGPGEAKKEFMDRLEHNNLEKKVVAVETVDKMTEPQIVVKVRKFFAEKK